MRRPQVLARVHPAVGRLTVAVVLAAAMAACGSGGSKGASGGDGPKSLAVSAASYDLAVGPPARFIAGVQTSDGHLIGFGSVQMRFAYLGTRQNAAPGPAGPPVTASFLSIPGANTPSPPPSVPQVVQGGERGVYGAQAGFDQAGFWQVEVTARVGGSDTRGTGAFAVNAKHQVPAAGDAALPSENLTVSSAVPKAQVDSRAGTGGEVPDPELHGTTIAAALAAKRPAVVVFSTPTFCQSQFCGPITDMVGDLAKAYPDRASFVHVEIFKDHEAHDPNAQLSDAARQWLFRNDDLNEPWVYVIGADGRITARFDNVVTREELEPLIARLPAVAR